jgi:hypothetical protein
MVDRKGVSSTDILTVIAIYRYTSFVAAISFVPNCANRGDMEDRIKECQADPHLGCLFYARGFPR